MKSIMGLILQKEESIAMVCTAIFIGMGILFLLTILISRMIRTRQRQLDMVLQESFQKTLNSFLVLGIKDRVNHASWRYNLIELNNQLTTAYRKQLLIDLLIATRKNLSGSSAETLRNVYIRLGLKRISKAKLESSDPSVKIAALHELAEFKCTDAIPEIEKLFRHRKRIIREESFIAMVRLLGADSSSLMQNYHNGISPWMQVTIYNHLASQPSNQMPKFYDWFNVDNKELKKFAIIMACRFKQLNALPGLADLLHDKDLEIAGLAAASLAKMGASEYADQIAELGRRNMTTDSVSKIVVQALGKIGNSDRHGEFLRWQMIHGSYAIRVEAIRTLHHLGLNIRDFLIDFNTENDSQIEKIFKHVTNPLLQ